MSLTDFQAISPMVILAAGIVASLLVLSMVRSHQLTVAMAVMTLLLSMAALPISSLVRSNRVASLATFDSYALLYAAMVLGTALIVCILSYGYLIGRQTIKEEFYILLLIAALGCCCLVASCHFVSFVLALEIVSVSLYVLVAYLRAEPIHIEAGIKYLVPAATSMAFLLMGAAFLYAWSGSLDFSAIAFRATAAPVPHNLFLLAGLALVMIGVGFKLALVPFHLWAADVFEGSPAPIAGFIATASKGAVFALLLRYWTQINAGDCRPLFMGFAVLAVITMFVGNLLALQQENVKRILAYSSIAHMGYLLTALLAGGQEATASITVYWLAYFITTLGAFGVITVLSHKEKDIGRLDEYRGLAYRSPILAGILTVFLLSLAGIPFTAGFIGKFFIFYSNADADHWFLLAILVVNSAIGIFYYLRVIGALYSPMEESQAMPSPQVLPTPSGSLSGGLVLAFLSLFLVCMGLYPAPFIGLVQWMIRSLV
jgi:NADH-quinone oxidoreductase subunit N